MSLHISNICPKLKPTFKLNISIQNPGGFKKGNDTINKHGINLFFCRDNIVVI